MILPILESSILTPLPSPRDFYAFRLSNHEYQGYSIGFASVRVAELWVTAIEALVGRLIRCHNEVRVQEMETVRVMLGRTPKADCHQAPVE